MGRGSISRNYGRWIIVLFGAVYVTFGLDRVLFTSFRDYSLISGVITFCLVGIPGLVLLYGGYRLPETDLDPDTYPRIVAWCLVGVVAILVFLGLLHIEPRNPYQASSWATIFSTAIGAAGGFVVGVYDAQTITQAQQLQRQRHDLQQQNERLDAFASLLAHELRNPLSIAQIYHQQAVDGNREAVEMVEDALTRIEEMIDVILVIVRGEDADLNREPVALAEAAEETWRDLDVSEAECLVETDRVLVVDPIHLRHVLENLFKNAIEHADADVTVRVGNLPSGFYVEDDGPGIPVDERDRVFEAGYTTDGTGFGLMFVAELAEIYGWSYTITESADGGTRFEFTETDLASVSSKQKH